MWTQTCKDGNKLGGLEAVTFFKRSGLPTDKLKEIWLIAARTNASYLLKEDFYLALRLIAYTQNGIEATEKSLQMDLEVALP